MKTMATLFISLILTGCASTFETFEAAKQTCHNQGKKLLYHNKTMEPLACMTEDEFATLKAKLSAAPEARTSPSQDIAAGMILQGFALRPLIPAMQPYNPPPLPTFVPSPLPRSFPPVSCSSTFVGGYAQTDCY